MLCRPDESVKVFLCKPHLFPGSTLCPTDGGHSLQLRYSVPSHLVLSSFLSNALTEAVWWCRTRMDFDQPGLEFHLCLLLAWWIFRSYFPSLSLCFSIWGMPSTWESCDEEWNEIMYTKCLPQWTAHNKQYLVIVYHCCQYCYLSKQEGPVLACVFDRNHLYT